MAQLNSRSVHQAAAAGELGWAALWLAAVPAHTAGEMEGP